MSAGLPMSDLRVCADAAELAQVGAQYFIKLAEGAIAAQGRFSVALSGGSTPRDMYQRLAEEFSSRLDWSSVYVFWGDERCVPPDHADSNYRMAHESLLDHLPIPPGHIHRMRGEIPPEQVAVEYEQTLRVFFGESSPARFDLAVLGLGEDGHTASLFPGTAALHEQARWVIAHEVRRLGAWRITLTPVILNAAAHVVFVVSGAKKAAILREVRSGPYRPDTLPAQIINPTIGNLLWLVDRSVAIE